MTAQVIERPDQLKGPKPQELLLPGREGSVQVKRNLSNFLIPVGTHWVERDVLFISEEISRRWPSAIVVSCNRNHPGECAPVGHYPHMVMERLPDGRTLPVMGFERFEPDVIHRLQAIHVSQDPQATHEQINRRERKARHQRVQEHGRELAEIVGAALRSNSHSWKGPDGIAASPHGAVRT